MIEPTEGMVVYLSQLGGSGNTPCNNGEDGEGPDYRVWVYHRREILEAELADDAIEWMEQVQSAGTGRRPWDDAVGMINSLVLSEGRLFQRPNGSWWVQLDGEAYGPIEIADA